MPLLGRATGEESTIKAQRKVSEVRGKRGGHSQVHVGAGQGSCRDMACCGKGGTENEMTLFTGNTGVSSYSVEKAKEVQVNHRRKFRCVLCIPISQLHLLGDSGGSNSWYPAI